MGMVCSRYNLKKNFVSISYSNLIWNLALITLAKQTLDIKYGIDAATYQISKPGPSSFTQEYLKNFPI